MDMRSKTVRAARAGTGRRHARLAAATALGTTLSLGLLAMPSAALAADECGVAVTGTVTCTPDGNPYADGVSYTSAGDFTLNTETGTQIGNTVAIDGLGGVAVNHAGTIATTGTSAPGLDINAVGPVTVVATGDISTAGDTATGILVRNGTDVNVQVGNVATTGLGASALDITGETVAATVNGTVSTTGTPLPPADPEDPDGVETTADGVVLTSTVGNVAFVNNGTVNINNDAGNGNDGTGVFITSAGDVTLGGTGKVSIGFGTGYDIAAAGSVSGTIANTSATTGGFSGTAILISAGGPVDLTLANIGATGSGTSIATTAGDIDVRANTVASNINLTTDAGAIRFTGTNLSGSGSILLTSTGGDATATIDTGTINTINATSNDGAASVALAGTINSGMTSGTTTPQSTNVIVSGGTTATVDVAANTKLQLSALSFTSTTGSTFVNRGQIDADAFNGSFQTSGGSLTFQNSGRFTGKFQFASTDNLIENSGTLTVNTGQSDLGGGTSRIVNTGTLTVTPTISGTSTAQNPIYVPNSFQLTNLDRIENSGAIDLRNRAAGDVVRISGRADGSGGGNFVASGGSALYVDVLSGLSGTISDQLRVDGAITGTTQVFFNSLSGPAGLTSGTVFARGGVGTSATAFTAAGLPNNGLVQYAVTYNAADRSFSLVGTPGDTAARTTKLNEGAQQLWYRSADTLSSHLAEVRDARYGGYAKDGGKLWGVMYGQTSQRKGTQAVTAFGVSRQAYTGYDQDTFGGQLGLDVVSTGGADGFTVGISGGYQSSKLNFARSADRARFRVANAALLIGFTKGGLFANAIGKYDHYWIRSQSIDAGYSDRFNGNSYGGQGEVGYRFGSTGFYLEPVATIAYVRTNLDDLDAGSTRFDFGVFEGLRGKAGARFGSRFDLGGGASILAYGQANYVHEFKGDKAVTIENSGFRLGLGNRELPDYGEGRIGFTAGNAGGVSGFVEAFGIAGKDYKGGGGRAGLRLKL